MYHRIESIAGRKDEGVSPVIATILMVAITVVLAASLYMMLPDASEAEQQTSGEFVRPSEKVTGTTNYRITFSKIKPDRNVNQITFKVWNKTKSGTELGHSALFSFDNHTDGATAKAEINGTTFKLIYDDQSGNQYIDSGDSLVLTEEGDSELWKYCYYKVGMYHDGQELDTIEWKVK